MPRYIFLLFIFLNSNLNYSQEWMLRLSSHVDLRTWKLTTKADKEETSLGGATIILYNGATIVSQTTSDSNGDFTVLVPPNSEFILTVSYAGCNTKKFSIITTGVPDNIAKDNFKPSFSIGGFVMARPFPGIDYSGLQQSLVKIIYKEHTKKFDDDDSYTEVGLNIVSKISNAENILIEKFCSTNRSGDVALAKPDCPLAKTLYNQAISLVPGEDYPVIQLAKVGLCLKDREEANKKVAGEAAIKAQQEKILEEKKLSEKANAEKIVAEKKEADKRAKEKATADKAEAEKIKKEKVLADKMTSDHLKKEKNSTGEKTPLKEEKKNSPEKTAKQKMSDNKPSDEKKFTTDTGPKEYNGAMEKGNSDHKIQRVLGADKYKEIISKADGYFKTKRYQEAKTAYLEALKIKADDVYAKSRLAETEKNLSVK